MTLSVVGNTRNTVRSAAQNNPNLGDWDSKPAVEKIDRT
jgi:hypothetical protein